MKKSILITLTFVTIIFLLGLSVNAYVHDVRPLYFDEGMVTNVVAVDYFAVQNNVVVYDDLIVNSRGIDLYSVLNCPQTGFVMVHYLDNGGIIFEVETCGPKENVAGLVLELRFNTGSEVQKHQFTIDNDGRSSVKIKTPQLVEQDLEIWIIDTPEMFIGFFEDHPNFVFEDGHMLSLKTRSKI